MIAAIRDLNDVAGPQFIVVVTGGEDSCNPQADDLVAAEAERAGIDLQTYVVGFMVSEQQAIALKTLAEKAGIGTYYNAPDAAALRVALLDIQGRIEQGGGLSAVASEPDAEVDEHPPPPLPQRSLPPQQMRPQPSQADTSRKPPVTIPTSRSAREHIGTTLTTEYRRHGT